MVIMGVESVHSNIVHDEGLEDLRCYLKFKSDDLMHPTDFIVQLTEWILKNNVFLLKDKLYSQEKGKAMGAWFSLNYANLFLGLWEEQNIFLNNPFTEKKKSVVG